MVGTSVDGRESTWGKPLRPCRCGLRAMRVDQHAFTAPNRIDGDAVPCFDCPNPRVMGRGHSLRRKSNRADRLPFDNHLYFAGCQRSCSGAWCQTADEDCHTRRKLEDILHDQTEGCNGTCVHSPASKSWRSAATSASQSPSIVLCLIMKSFTCCSAPARPRRSMMPNRNWVP